MSIRKHKINFMKDTNIIVYLQQLVCINRASKMKGLSIKNDLLTNLLI